MRAIRSHTQCAGIALQAGPARAVLIAALIGAWVAGIGGGLAALANYANRAPATLTAPPHWPPESALPVNSGKPTLVVFIHPKCPCSSATLAELNRVLARSHGAAHTVTVALYTPDSQPREWNRTSLRETAEQIPGVRVMDDPEGHEAARFGATNSGHAVVYSPAGELLFCGGITSSRGHEGDNAGADSVATALHGGQPAVLTTPTYGCQIASPGEEAACPECEGEHATG